MTSSNKPHPPPPPPPPPPPSLPHLQESVQHLLISLGRLSLPTSGHWLQRSSRVPHPSCHQGQGGHTHTHAWVPHPSCHHGQGGHTHTHAQQYDVLCGLAIQYINGIQTCVHTVPIHKSLTSLCTRLFCLTSSSAVKWGVGCGVLQWGMLCCSAVLCWGVSGCDVCSLPPSPRPPAGRHPAQAVRGGPTLLLILQQRRRLAAASGLHWAVRGCLCWCSEGLVRE